MHELMNAIRTLAIIVIGFAVMLQLITPGDAFKRIARMLVIPFIVLFAWTFVVQVWNALSPVARIAVIGVGVPLSGAVLLVSTRFGREVLASVLGNWLYDGLRAGCATRSLLILFLLLLAAFFVFGG
jgi:hypothetical protein